MRNGTILAAALALAFWAAPAVAQDVEAPADTTVVPAPPDTTTLTESVEEAADAVAEDIDEAADETVDAAEAVADETGEAVGAAVEEIDETADEVAEETAEAVEDEEPVVEQHDWEFALSATESGAGASGEVQVTEGESGRTFVVEVAGLPQVDQLDQPGRDVNAYTVWVVPSKERVAEATLAGVLTADPESGEGAFEGTTPLATFGVIVTATEDGAPERIGGVPVLTGIPVTPAAEMAEPEAEAEAAPEANEPAAEVTAETPPAAETDASVETPTAPEAEVADEPAPEEPATPQP